ncbi:reprolysin-like metallo-peptidase family M12B [Pseudoduganella lurida]|uniref:Reprolysin-like metallo-peptidase family M12B n=1 Tax=Pseudoduganella lurida TaxID=1036180 RepID=A0A562RMH4_9BURK|nr:M12 family metallo-peptidase [Pseudoduganella lurida]TWI70222.1 reprolysin-like metallo-peptidase family M12B [Pseudoduganella lurida]
MRLKPRPNQWSTPDRGQLQRKHPGVPATLALCISLALSGAAPAAQAAKAEVAPVSNVRAAPYWQDVAARTDALAAGTGKKAALQLRRYHGATLDRSGMKALTAGAPQERTTSPAASTLTISLPHPDGGYQRFTLVESPIMEAGLAAKHPGIKTYRGKGIDDPAATLRMDITQLGLHASVRSPNGGWYVDPYYRLDDSLYASYHSHDLVNQHGPLVEGALGDAQLTLSRGFYKEGDNLEVRGLNFTPGASVRITVRSEGDSTALQSANATADANGVVTLTLPNATAGTGAFEVVATDGRSESAVSYHVVDTDSAANAAVGTQLRTYRLALVTDPSYATYFGGAANVTAAKVSLINRVSQIYEDETSIRLVLIDATDALNLDTAAQMTGTNGPCGGAACFTQAQASSCTSSSLTRNRIVTGLLAGAGNFDVGHLALGVNGGGVASLGVVGGNSKSQGCTGIPTPEGDFYAVDYVAHELGHQFSGNHTFNGVNSNCSGGNRNEETSVEPGSGSSIMAYAGICGTDNLQPHSDPYWSQRSFDEIVTYTSGAEATVNEVQVAVLRGFATAGAQFQVSWNGSLSTPIVRGTSYTTAGVRAAIQAIPGWPAGATASVSALTDTGFTVTFGGSLAGTNVPSLQVVNLSGGATGYVGEVAVGGPTTRRGAISSSGNSAPLVSAPAGYTIPVRTPFALTGSATDADGDAVTYLWEQNDIGERNGTGLVSNIKTNGPLFSQFGKRAVVSATDTLQYNSPGENHVTTDPTRVFPDIDQILANNTNALTGACPTPAATPTATDIECFAEFLPTAAYLGRVGANANPPSLNFRLTARDGQGGVSSADTQLVLAPAAGPFLVTSPNTAVTLEAGSTQTVTWSVANTDVAPVSTANVAITLSVDGGHTWPYTLAESTPNDGSAAVRLPVITSSTARIKVAAVDNVFFDVSNANLTIRLTGDINGDSAVNCGDLAVVKASLGKATGQAGFDARADVVTDGIINVRDLTYVAQRVPAGTVCN